MSRRAFRALAAGLAALVALAVSGPPARADCVSVQVDVPRAFRQAAVVFAGTIVAGDAERLTFRADRVWKGRLDAQVTIHLRGRPNAESYRFRPGERHLVFAQVVGADDDPDDLPAGVLAMPRGCASPPWPLTLEPELDKLARPRVLAR